MNNFLQHFRLLAKALRWVKNHKDTIQVVSEWGVQDTPILLMDEIDDIEADEDLIGCLVWRHEGQEFFLRIYTCATCEITFDGLSVEWPRKHLPTDAFEIYKHAVKLYEDRLR